MKIFFDARFIRTDYHDGISRFGTELGNALADLTPVTFIIYDKKQLNFLPSGAKFVMLNNPTSLKEFTASLKLNKYHPDIVYSPMQTLGSFGRKFKLVYSLHDMIYYRHRRPPAKLNPFLKLGWLIYHSTYAFQRATLNSADGLVTVSEISKDDILKARLTKRPVEVIYNAPQDLLKRLNRPMIQDPKGPRNIVYAGSFMPYKNVETLIKSMKWLPEHTLYLLGRATPARQAELSKLVPKDAKVIFYGPVVDDQYAKILADNAVMASASLDEGFGLPIADALKNGIPAVITDMPVFHEVAGDGALYAKTSKEFANQILALNNKKVHDELIERGKKHIERFSWDKSARKLLDFLELFI